MASSRSGTHSWAEPRAMMKKFFLSAFVKRPLPWDPLRPLGIGHLPAPPTGAGEEGVLGAGLGAGSDWAGGS